MQLPSLLGHSAELVRIIRKSTQPADAVAREYLRSRKYIGAKDRRFISSHTFYTLRILALAEAYAVQHNIPEVTQAAYELDLTSAWVNTQPMHVQVNTQEWLLAATQASLPDATSVWRSMMQQAPVGIRVNLRHTTRERIVEQLRAQDIDARPSPLTPACIVINERVNILQHPLYLDGFIEIQDEGSQRISLATNVQPGMRVLDACAGAGGKSMHLADLMNGQGAIVSRDIEWQRLKEIPKRAARAGITNIQTQKVSEGSGTRNHPFDVVLVDAPCSGMGTVRRSPMVKWRLTPKQLEKHAAKQLMILSHNASEVRIGGTLVYATCSILAEENGHVVESFLRDHPTFSLEEQQQLDPFHDGTDGLYWARCIRNE